MPNPPVKKKLVVLEEGLLTSMANNQMFLNEFPFLGNIRPKVRKKGCGKCGRAGQERTSLYGGVKTAFAGLDSNKKRRLKELLNTNQVRIIYKQINGKIIQLTF